MSVWRFHKRISELLGIALSDEITKKLDESMDLFGEDRNFYGRDRDRFIQFVSDFYRLYGTRNVVLYCMLYVFLDRFSKSLVSEFTEKCGELGVKEHVKRAYADALREVEEIFEKYPTDMREFKSRIERNRDEVIDIMLNEGSKVYRGKGRISST